MLEQQLAAAQAEVNMLRGRLGAATAQLCAAATPSNPALLAVLRVRAYCSQSPMCSNSAGPAQLCAYAVRSTSNVVVSRAEQCSVSISCKRSGVSRRRWERTPAQAVSGGARRTKWRSRECAVAPQHRCRMQHQGRCAQLPDGHIHSSRAHAPAEG
jgi:hypothetical protein